MDRRLQDRPLGLPVVERADKAEAHPLLGGENHRARQRAAEDLARFGAHEGRGEHQLVANDGAVEAQVVAVDLPGPGPLLAGFSEEGQEVQPLRVFIRPARHLTEQPVQPHDVADLGEAPGRQAGLHQAKAKPTRRRWEILQHHAVTKNEGVGVQPLAALGRIEREHRPLALLAAERAHKRGRGFGDRRGAYARRPQRKQTRRGDALGGKAQERLAQRLGPLLDHGLHRRREAGRPACRQGGHLPEPEICPVLHGCPPTPNASACPATRNAWHVRPHLNQPGGPLRACLRVSSSVPPRIKPSANPSHLAVWCRTAHTRVLVRLLLECLRSHMRRAHNGHSGVTITADWLAGLAPIIRRRGYVKLPRPLTERDTAVLGCETPASVFPAETAQQRLLLRAVHSWRRNGALSSSAAGSSSSS